MSSFLFRFAFIQHFSHGCIANDCLLCERKTQVKIKVKLNEKIKSTLRRITPPSMVWRRHNKRMPIASKWEFITLLFTPRIAKTEKHTGSIYNIIIYIIIYFQSSNINYLIKLNRIRIESSCLFSKIGQNIKSAELAKKHLERFLTKLVGENIVGGDCNFIVQITDNGSGRNNLLTKPSHLKM